MAAGALVLELGGVPLAVGFEDVEAVVPVLLQAADVIAAAEEMRNFRRRLQLRDEIGSVGALA
jgi:hypothetical protein